MPTYLLAASPIHGHVGPVLRVARHLADRGHDVTVLTGSRFEQDVAAASGSGRPLRFVSLPGRADFDDRDPDTFIPDREKYQGVRRAQYEIGSLFVETAPDQARTIDRLVRELSPDAILVDNAFAGALPLVIAGGDRPAVLALGVSALSQSEPGLAPFGLGLPPARSNGERVRYRAMGLLARRVLFRGVQKAGERAFAEAGVALEFNVMDASRQFDRFCQLGPRGFDYPRTHLSQNVHYVGAIPPTPIEGPLPDWWHELDGSRPVVHVTQGTIDNRDFGRLVQPTLDALADRDCLVVATTGGRPAESVGALPANARVGEYLPYGDLLPRTDAFVTNGGFGGVQAALADGVPIVVAGVTEEKPEVTARIAWTGAGIDLKTGEPSARAVGDAVDAVLTEPSYREAAQRLQAEIAEHDTLAEIERHLAEAVAEHTG